LYFGKELSGTDLSERIHRSLPLTNKLLCELKEAGSVVELGFAPSKGGRRPMLYSLDKSFGYIVSVAMDQLFTRIGILTADHTFVTAIERHELNLSTEPDALAILGNLIEKHIRASGLEGARIIGVGIGMPGFIDLEKGVNYSFFRSENESLQKSLQDRLQLPVFIDNDSSLVALAEYRFGAARDKRNVMVVNVSWGIGLGMVLNGELFRGNNGFAGEFSHIPIFSSNKLCSCGKTGCLETEASLLVLVEKAIKGIEQGKITNLPAISLANPEEACSAIIRMALKGDKFCVELIAEIGYNIGRGLAILIHILNPELIILSGRGATAGKLWNAPIQQAINEHSIPRLAEHTAIEISSVGNKDELYGAAALVMENYDREVLKKSKRKGNSAPQTFGIYN
ncbi:ROK family protein, partial [Flavihumibacter sp. CACIAM 22H1]|uniref:ROK family protein n=1 Tax=Flavihumibacter sp. CACIAM 22H1 TaxID=1812911 RepID=UPI000ACAFD55